MKILAIDSSGLVASVAIVDGSQLVAEYTIDYKKTHSQTLLPMLDEIKSMIDLDLSTIDAIAVAKGPGSFTGLRIGSATAKGIAQAIDAPIIEIPTMDGMAYNLFGTQHVICPIMDARRNQVYSGFYTFVPDDEAESGYRFEVRKPQFVADMHEVIAELNALGQPVVFLGDGVPVQLASIQEELTVPFGLAPANCNRQHASSVAALATAYFEAGNTIPAPEHKPDYLRLSQAERERLEKQHA